MSMRIFTFAVAVLALSCGQVVLGLDEGAIDRDRIELIATVEIPGSARDKSGLDVAFDAATTNNMLGGFSGLEYSGKNDIYLALSDRGPQDGAVDWSCRVQKVRIPISPAGNQAIEAELLETILLLDETGRPFTGLAAAFKAEKSSVNFTSNRSANPSRFDPEGIRVGDCGQLFISDEYGPRVIEFSSDGKMVREFTMPEKILINSPGLNKLDENSNNTSGRQSNRGMEGLAISLDQKTLFGLIQSPLLQDCETTRDTYVVSTLVTNPKNGVSEQIKTTVVKEVLTGLNCRLLQFSVSGEHQKEVLYPLDQSSNKLNEILAIDDDSFIVIERDGAAGVEAAFKKIMLISTKQATDISAMEKLPPKEIPVAVTPVAKRVLIDMLDPRWNLAGEAMPEKIEGLTFGPRLSDGRRTLLVNSDNDFEAMNPSYIYVFAVPEMKKK